MQVTAIIAAAGEGRRVGAAVPKQLLEIGGRTILERSVEAFASHPEIQDVIVVLPRDVAVPSAGVFRLPQVRVVEGGARRQDSVANAFDAVHPFADVVVIHDAARPFVTPDLISQSIRAAAEHGAVVAARPAHDTVKRVALRDGATQVQETLPRETIYLAQTPQAFRRDVLQRAIALGREGTDATDEAALAEAAGCAVHVIEGAAGNVKITTADDLEWARMRAAGPLAGGRVGTGYDLHRLVEGRPLWIGGIQVPSERGALGHSDGDVVCHSATDAILGAASLGDIGRHFPDSDPAWKGASSIDLLRRAVAIVHDAGFRVVNLDVVVILERPRIAPLLASMREQLAAALGVDAARISIKGKTNEGVDAVGRGEAIAAHAVALLAQNS